MKSPRNIPASVRQRILNRAKSDRRPFNELLQYYAMERFLYRLSQSAHADRFILKGALMLRVWRSPELRPTMLDSPAPRLLCYSRESSIAEKFEVMIKLGVLNSRMKDFYDIWLLSRQFDFDGARLAEAIRLTLERRGTALPTEIEAFTEAFIDAKQIQWTTFWKRLQQDHVPVSFKEVTTAVDGFLAPVVAAISSGKPSPTNWIASGPWS